MVYEYVFTNPDKLSHLPESVDEAVLFTNVLGQVNGVSMNGRGFQLAYIMSKLNNVNIDLMYKHLVKHYGEEWIKISEEEIKQVQQNFSPRIAIIAPDKGIASLLPPWADIEPDPEKLDKRNVLSVNVNAKNELLVRDELMQINQLRTLAKEFIKNPNRKENYAESPQKAIISLQNERETSYETYIEVYKELKGAYEELWEEEAQARFGKSYKEVNREEKKVIRTTIPFVLSESEPTNFDKDED